MVLNESQQTAAAEELQPDDTVQNQIQSNDTTEQRNEDGSVSPVY